MKHASSRELYAYWDRCRRGRRAPERADIEPGEIRRVLGDTFILSLDSKAGHPFRLAGTRVCALFGREIKGEAFIDLWAEDERNDLRDVIATVADDVTGFVAGIPAVNDDGGGVALELLLLPLAQNKRTDARVLGALAALDIPYWLGVRPISALRLGSLRHIGAEGAPELVPGVENVRLRKGLVVFEGGRSD